MRDIIKKIFNDYHFEERELPISSNNDIFFAVNLKKESLNFYLVVFLDEYDIELLEMQVSEFYNAIKGIEAGYDERMDKNLSMLVCLRDDNILPKEKLMRKVFEIEEDPYYFKKYVFTYNEEQFKFLSEYFIGNNDTHSNTLINNIVNNTDLFISFKKEPNDNINSLYNLCSKLLIKLPFIVYERGEKEIENLSGKIKEILIDEALINYSKKWLELKEENGAFNIDNILEVILEGEKNDL